MTSVMNSAAAAEAKLLNLHGPQVFIPDTEVINPQPAENTNTYVEPIAGGSKAAVAHQLSKIEQIVEYLKVLYR
jgi:hypothetical protein